ncbi:MAG: hypothetical protein ACFFCS_16685 [Candidatus Hodarchaeota archaeon]
MFPTEEELFSKVHEKWTLPILELLGEIISLKNFTLIDIKQEFGGR